MHQFIIALQNTVTDLREIDVLDLDFAGKGQHAALSNAQHVRAFTFTYLSAGNTISGFIVIPNTIYESMPVIVFNRGGFKDFGIVTSQELFLYLADMAQWGYVVIGTQYPGNTLSEGKDERGGKGDIQSIIDLYDVLVQLPRVDINRIGVCAGSRGAMMTTLLIKKVPWVKAAVMTGGEFNAFRSAQRRPEIQTLMDTAFGGDDEGKRARSAIFWADELPNDCPLLIMHGAQDTRVNPQSALEFCTRLQQHKKPYRLIIFEQGDHYLQGHYKEFMDQAKRWLNRHVKNHYLLQ